MDSHASRSRHAIWKHQGLPSKTANQASLYADQLTSASWIACPLISVPELFLKRNKARLKQPYLLALLPYGRTLFLGLL